MSIFDFIYRQTDGFFKAGKTLKKPESDKDLMMSRLIALILAVFTILFYSFLTGLSFSLPARIHLRALIYLAPIIGFIVKFYQGISVSWMFRGLKKYWLIPALLIFIWIIVVQMLYLAFFGGSFRFFNLSGGLMMVSIGLIFFIYFRKKGQRHLYTPEGEKLSFTRASTGHKASYLGWNLFSLVYLAIIAGGLVMLLNAAGFWEWFFKDLLGW